MARPCKKRYISSPPEVSGFQPLDPATGTQDETLVGADELEALKLAHLAGLSQEEGAARMNVSRATFGRILERAHRLVADALVHGKAIKITGGRAVRTTYRHLRCGRCRRDWSVPRSTAATFRCPRCK